MTDEKEKELENTEESDESTDDMGENPEETEGQVEDESNEELADAKARIADLELILAAHLPSGQTIDEEIGRISRNGKYEAIKPGRKPSANRKTRQNSAKTNEKTILEQWQENAKKVGTVLPGRRHPKTIQIRRSK